MRAFDLERWRSRLPALARHRPPPSGQVHESDVVSELLAKRQSELERIHDELLALESRMRKARTRCESDYWIG